MFFSGGNKSTTFFQLALPSSPNKFAITRRPNCASRDIPSGGKGSVNTSSSPISSSFLSSPPPVAFSEEEEEEEGLNIQTRKWLFESGEEEEEEEEVKGGRCGFAAAAADLMVECRAPDLIKDIGIGRNCQ